MPLTRLQQVGHYARLLSTHLKKVIHIADERLALPVIGSNNFPRPFNSDWAWRPELWRMPLSDPGSSSVPSKYMLGKEVTLFHDCSLSELTLRQLRNKRVEDLAPYGMRIDVFKFEGSYLSLAIDLPQEATNGLTQMHLIKMNFILEIEKPLEIYARLNIKHGPNVEQMVRELPLHEEDIIVEFDLAYSNINEKRVEKAWVDLIFDNLEMNQVIVRDLTFTRRPRAAV